MFRYQIRPKVKVLISKLLAYALIAYVFFILGRSVWANWYLKSQTEKIQAQIERRKQENNNLRNLILYYQSNSFKEVEARKKLGLKKQGEYVMAVPVKKIENFQEETNTQASRLASREEQEKLPHYVLWWLYFTK